MFQQKKKQFYFSLVLIYTVSNQLPQKVFFNESSVYIFGLEKTQPATRNFRVYRNTAIHQHRVVVFLFFSGRQLQIIRIKIVNL